ncbi:MAG: motility protein A [Lachnospiraceae bacterium]|nr:motility protein A [Lachnospiraceae bacterium]
MLVTIFFGIATNGGLRTILNFIHLPSFIVTFGGAFFAVMATADSMSDYLDGLKSIFEAFIQSPPETKQITENILEMSDRARKEGLLSLETDTGSKEDFLQKGIRLIVDGTDPELVRDILENELSHKEERDRKRVRFWQDMGSYGPAWGMLGTLLGLINMMRSMGTDADAIGAGMALALITTLYGSVLANWICLPTARKLEKNSAQECLAMEIVIEGVLSIQAGENTRIIKEKLKSIMDMEERGNS